MLKDVGRFGARITITCTVHLVNLAVTDRDLVHARGGKESAGGWGGMMLKFGTRKA